MITASHRTVITSQEHEMYLMHEALARARMCEDQHHAREARLARRLTATCRWRRLARYASRRAARAAAML